MLFKIILILNLKSVQRFPWQLLIFDKITQAHRAPQGPHPTLNERHGCYKHLNFSNNVRVTDPMLARVRLSSICRLNRTIPDECLISCSYVCCSLHKDFSPIFYMFQIHTYYQLRYLNLKRKNYQFSKLHLLMIIIIRYVQYIVPTANLTLEI